MGCLGARRTSVSFVRFGRRLEVALVVVVLTVLAGERWVDADFPTSGPTVGCQASTTGLNFDGTCVGIQGPSAPTHPSLNHAWSTAFPTVAQACAPYLTTEWAVPSVDMMGGPNGGLWTLGGQRIPLVSSTPLTDWGWVYTVSCGVGGGVRFTRVTSASRTPSPCSPGTAPTACLPGLNPRSFLAAVAGQVPAESIAATPPGPGVVGIPVEATLAPVPVTAYAEIDLSEPDLGDGDLGELLHVVWLVEAVPEAATWTWPDGTTSSSGSWIPQTYDVGGAMRVSLAYQVTASGFWSDGVAVHRLPTVTVGTIPILTQLGYSVEQVQPGLG